MLRKYSGLIVVVCIIIGFYTVSHMVESYIVLDMPDDVVLAEKHNPYRRYNDHKALPVLSKIIKDLVDKGDIVQTTAHEFIVGMLLRHLRLEGLVDQEIRPEYPDKVAEHFDLFNGEHVKIAEIAEDCTLLWQWDEDDYRPFKQPHEMDRTAYDRFKSHPAWRVIDVTIDSLVNNTDLVETTARECIVGYIVEQLDQRGLLINPPLDLPIKCCT